MFCKAGKIIGLGLVVCVLELAISASPVRAINSTVSASPTVSPTGTTSAQPTTPVVCLSLTANLPATPTSRFNYIFEAAGKANVGQIISSSLDFGDSPPLTLPTTGKITISHTYGQPGNYQASVIFFTNQGASSNRFDCLTRVVIADLSRPTPSAVPPPATNRATGTMNRAILTPLLGAGAVVFLLLLLVLLAKLTARLTAKSPAPAGNGRQTARVTTDIPAEETTIVDTIFEASLVSQDKEKGVSWVSLQNDQMKYLASLPGLLPISGRVKVSGKIITKDKIPYIEVSQISPLSPINQEQMPPEDPVPPPPANSEGSN